MKKNKIKKLHFNSFCVTELNTSQLRNIIAGNEPSTLMPLTQTGPPDKFSAKCIEITPIKIPELTDEKK